MQNSYMIETHGLSKRYGTFDAVQSLCLQVSSHRITGFLGQNGAGKSTTIKMLLGMTHPTSGDGKILGRSITDAKANREARRKVAYVGEDKQLYGYMTVEQIVRFTKSFYPDWRPEIETRLLRQYRLPLDRKVKALSKGMRTKLALLLAFSRQPALLILDEPSEGLDQCQSRNSSTRLSGPPPMVPLFSSPPIKSRRWSAWPSRSASLTTESS